MTKYELMVILPGDMTEKEALKHLETVKGYVTENGGTITDELIMGKQDFAYTIKKYDTGFYATFLFESDNAEGMKELSEELRLDPKVLRELTLKVPEEYSFANFEKEAEEAQAIVDEIMEKRNAKRNKKKGPKKAEDKKEAPAKKATEKKTTKKSVSDSVLDDPDLTL